MKGLQSKRYGDDITDKTSNIMQCIVHCGNSMVTTLNATVKTIAIIVIKTSWRYVMLLGGTGGDVTLEQSVQNVIELQSSSELTNDINNDDKVNDSDIKKLKEMVRALTEKVDQQQ